MAKDILRSPFFYVGDKYKLMKQLQVVFPNNINNYIEPFVGGGSSVLNTEAKEYIVNDLNEYVIKLHLHFNKYKDNSKKLFDKLFKLIKKYKLSCSYKGVCVEDSLKKSYPKTYYAVYNKDGYNKLKEDFNKKKSDMNLFYLLLVYGFNHMIRFNSKGEFNLPVGNVDFNNNVVKALTDYLNFLKDKKITLKNLDYITFLNDIDFKEDDFVFFDPPYLISTSEYNKLWNEEKEKELLEYLDLLDSKGVKWGITNLINHKGKANNIFKNWAEKYNTYEINSNYISFNDNTIKTSSQEVYITNVRRETKEKYRRFCG
jgi:DNA adenine methylase